MNPSVQTDEQLGAGPNTEVVLADPIPKSSGARRPTEKSTKAVDELGDGEQLVLTVDEPAAVPRAMAGAAGSLEAEVGVADAVSESRVEKSVVPEEQTALPKASDGMVGHAVWPPNPLVVPPAMEEDKVEEIEHEEARPQAVRILCKWGNEVVVVEEKDTTREVRRLESTLSTAMK